VARLVGQRLGEQTGQTVIVDNRTGASGDIAASAVARAAPDGDTLLLAPVSLVTNPVVTGKPGFFPTQLVPLGVGIEAQLVTVKRKTLDATDIKGLLALARSDAGKLNAASAGVATLSHLGIELLGSPNGVRFNHIPYRGSVPAMTDTIAGQTDIMIETIFNAMPYISAGKVTPLAVHSSTRNPLLPDTPTYAEQGFKAMEFSAWNTFMVPAGTPPATRQRLHDALAKAMAPRDVTAALLSRGITPVVQTPEASEAFIKGEAARWGKVIKDANVTL
jgi:tripartite-type tricarboxylate transporter receptor subunit TctC